MKKFAQVLPLIFFAFISTTFAQEKPTEWIRVQSNNGEFSIEVPKRYDFIFDKDGFQISSTFADDFEFRNFELRNMYMMNAFLDKTLLSFESWTWPSRK